MGLDMYLNAKRFIWHNEKEIAEAISKIFPELNGKGKRVQEVIVRAIFWRKANAIHKWFVDNVQNGEDNCSTYDVEREQLEELRDLVQRVLEDHTLAESLLPTQEGFFFGGTQYDEYYFADLEHTRDSINAILEEFPDQWDFEYHSSW